MSRSPSRARSVAGTVDRSSRNMVTSSAEEGATYAALALAMTASDTVSRSFGLHDRRKGALGRVRL